VPDPLLILENPHLASRSPISLYVLNRIEIEQVLLDVFSVFLSRKMESSVVRTSESEWDSLKHLQILFAVEDKFGVQFIEEEIPRLNSLVIFTEQLENSHAA